MEELFECVDLLEELFAFVGITNAHAPAGEILQQGAVMYIRSGADGLFARFEGVMLDELDPVAVVDESVSGDACFLLVGFGEASVNDEAFAVGTHGCLSFDSTHRHVSVDDTSGGGVETELAQDMLAYMRVVG